MFVSQSTKECTLTCAELDRAQLLSSQNIWWWQERHSTKPKWNQRRCTNTVQNCNSTNSVQTQYQCSTNMVRNCNGTNVTVQIQSKTAMAPTLLYKHSIKLQWYECHDTVISQLFLKYLHLHMMWNKVYTNTVQNVNILFHCILVFCSLLTLLLLLSLSLFS